MKVRTKSALGTAALITAFILITPSDSWAHDASKLRVKNAKVTCQSLAQTDPAKIDRNNARVVQMLKLCEAKRRLREVRNQQRQDDLSIDGQSSLPPKFMATVNPEVSLIGDNVAVTPNYLLTEPDAAQFTAIVPNHL